MEEPMVQQSPAPVVPASPSRASDDSSNALELENATPVDVRSPVCHKLQERSSNPASVKQFHDFPNFGNSETFQARGIGLSLQFPLQRARVVEPDSPLQNSDLNSQQGTPTDEPRLDYSKEATETGWPKPRPRCKSYPAKEENLSAMEWDTPADTGESLSSTHAAVLQRLNMPDFALRRGPRPAPALGNWESPAGASTASRAHAGVGLTDRGVKEKDPLVNLVHWLDDADVADVVKDGGGVSSLFHVSDEAEHDTHDLNERTTPREKTDLALCDKTGLLRVAPRAHSITDAEIEQDQCEEEEWLARQKVTGAVGRLVRYQAGAFPKDDILGLRSTHSGRIMVTAVRPNGAAAKAGVTVGDELVSINGQKEFVGRPAHIVHADLKAPVTLVFLGFAGKLHAEVRVKRPPEPPCGMPSRVNVALPPANHDTFKGVELFDAIVFQPDNASLLLATGKPDEQSSDDGPLAAEKTVMWEVQREDAKNLVIRALGNTAAPEVQGDAAVNLVIQALGPPMESEDSLESI